MKLLLFPFHTYSLWQVSKWSPHFRRGELNHLPTPGENSYIYYLQLFHKDVLSLLPHFLFYDIICKFEFELQNIYFILWVITYQCHTHFVAQIIPTLAIVGSCALLTISILLFSFFSSSLLSNTTRYFGLFLHFLCTSAHSKIRHFSKEPWCSFYWRLVFWNQDYLGFSFFRLTHLRDIVQFTYTLYITIEIYHSHIFML